MCCSRDGLHEQYPRCDVENCMNFVPASWHTKTSQLNFMKHAGATRISEHVTQIPSSEILAKNSDVTKMQWITAYVSQIKLEYEESILTLSYTLFNTRGTEMKTVGLKEDKYEKAINIKNNGSFLGNVTLHHVQTYLRACRSSRMFRTLPPKNPTLPPYVNNIN